MKRYVAIILAILVCIAGADAYAAKKKTTGKKATTTSTQKKTTTSQPPTFMGKSINCTVQDMRDYLVYQKGFVDVTGEDTYQSLYFLVGPYADFEDCLIRLDGTDRKLAVLEVRVNLENNYTDNVYFQLLGDLDKKYGKHKLGYDRYKKDLEPYEYMLDDDVKEASHLAVWEKGAYAIYYDISDIYYSDFEKYDDCILSVQFLNVSELDRISKENEKRRLQNM